jgi:hypothetical protein
MTARRASSGVRQKGLCVAAAAMLGTAAPVLAQVSPGMRVQDVGINAGIGLVTATVWSVARGRGFTAGVWRGIVGGATVSVGRQVAASPFSGSGFTGREISAVGISLITSSGSDHLTLSFPVGPVQLQLVDGSAFDWRINATDAVAAVISATGKRTRLDARLSLSSGTFVFRSERGTFHTASGEATGSEFFESIKLASDAFDAQGRVPNVLFHENVHVLQDDHLETTVANPIARAVLERTEIGRRIRRHVDIGLLSVPLNGLANGVVPYAARPWEREAYALTPRHDY